MRDRKLPPLKALHAFEAVARHGSVTAAARELSVTPSAISQQIRLLESWAGVPFLARSGSRIALTERGGAYLARLTEAFDILEEATDRALGRRGATRLRVSVLPSFAGRWLIPRLQSFADAHPDIDVEIDSSSGIVDFDRDDVEVGIRYGLGGYPDAACELVLPDAVAPVLHPRFLEDAGDGAGVRQPADLARVRLLHETGALTGDKVSWRDWLAMAGVSLEQDGRGLLFSDTHLTIEAALAGEGAMLGRRVLVADLLAQGRLVAPFEPWLRDRPSYWLVHPRLRPPRPAAKAFMRWIKAQARLVREADPVLAG